MSFGHAVCRCIGVQFIVTVRGVRALTRLKHVFMCLTQRLDLRGVVTVLKSICSEGRISDTLELLIALHMIVILEVN